MKYAFSTLCCLDYSPEQVLELCQKSHMQGVELRFDAKKLQAPWDYEKIRESFRSAGIQICDIASSIFIKSDTVSETDLQYIDAASALGAAAVRVFVGEHVSKGFEHTAKKVPELAKAVRQLCAYAKEKNVEIWLETHSEFSTGKAMKLLIREAAMDNLKAIWDVIHSLEYGETLEDSIAHLGSHIAHVHLKDGVAVSGETEFLHTDLGVGQMPFSAVIQALEKIGYQGFLSLEWESPWRPEIRDLYPNPLVLLNRYSDLLRQHGG